MYFYPQYLKKERLLCQIFFLSLILFSACELEKKEGLSNKEYIRLKTSPIDHLPENKAGDVVIKAIEWSGGWNNWANKKTLCYTKKTQYLDSIGTIKREIHQWHQYRLQPELKVRITWVENGDSFTIINNGNQAWKFKNGEELVEKSHVNHAWNSSFGSNYVISMPFKLTDPGTVLSYEGLDTLVNGRLVHSIKTTYEEGAGSAGGMHTWWYYFDKDTYAPVANFLDYGDGYSFTQYESFMEKGGTKLNDERQSYSTNVGRELKHVSTIYKNEEIQFNLELMDSLFEPMN